MKRLLQFLLLALGATTVATATSFNVTATQAIRIALVDTEGRRGDTQRLEEALAPRFQEAVALIYGANTPVEFVRVGADMAADGLKRGVYDAGLVFSPRLPPAIRRTGFHLLRAVGSAERDGEVAFLVLRQDQPKLDELLANAFYVAVNHGDVRQVLQERRGMVVASR